MTIWSVVTSTSGVTTGSWSLNVSSVSGIWIASGVVSIIIGISMAAVSSNVPYPSTRKESLTLNGP